ncbi:hypothetical protein DICVIV_11454 [Dictyocaulus viviparus]|uniref:Uncharacterized protein n=1 Tax=Dictyocaulus viviparus TaxID=29172 RepID=A0A0D8XD54_DICVI|nr:hypothetical protein DICVIV_11454 [Dictyocaulus viviparus]
MIFTVVALRNRLFFNKTTRDPFLFVKNPLFFPNDEWQQSTAIKSIFFCFFIVVNYKRLMGFFGMGNEVLTAFRFAFNSPYVIIVAFACDTTTRRLSLERIIMSNNLKNRRKLQLVFDEQEKATKLASTATGFIILGMVELEIIYCSVIVIIVGDRLSVIASICFFVLPVVWSSMFHLLPLSTPVCTSIGFDPWSDFTDL